MNQGLQKGATQAVGAVGAIAALYLVKGVARGIQQWKKRGADSTSVALFTLHSKTASACLQLEFEVIFQIRDLIITLRPVS